MNIEKTPNKIAIAVSEVRDALKVIVDIAKTEEYFPGSAQIRRGKFYRAPRVDALRSAAGVQRFAAGP
jgi:hypothetical protein